MQKRWILGLIAVVAIVVFEGTVFYEVHIMWNDFWTIVAAEVLVVGGGVVTWTFRPEIMAFIGKAPRLQLELSKPLPTAWTDETTRNMRIDIFTLMQVLPEKGKLNLLSQSFKVTAINSTITNAGAKLWIEGQGEYHPNWAKLESTVDATTGNVSFKNPPQLITLIKGMGEEMVFWLAYKTKKQEYHRSKYRLQSCR